MKLQGKKAGLNQDVIVFPREHGDFVFRAQAVQDWDEFDAKCPAPIAPEYKTPDGTAIRRTDSPEYLAECEKHDVKKSAYLFLKSIEITEGLEWEKVDREKPSTWKHWREELTEFGLSIREVMLLESLVMEVNALSHGKLEAARKNFFRAQQARSKEAQVAQGPNG